jgi:hypothetical protein
LGRAQESENPVPHLVGGLVGESHRQHGLARHALDAHQAGDAMGDHPGLAASGSSQDQDRAFEEANCFTLLGIQTLKEVHLGEATPDSTTAAAFMRDMDIITPSKESN